MKSREFLMPLATGLAIFSMSVFISCASTSRIDEDGNEIEGTSVSESGDELSEGPATKADNNLGDVGQAKATVAEAPPPPAEAPTAAPTDALPPADSVPPPGGDLSELPPESAPPPADSLPSEAPPAPAGDIAAAAPTGGDTLPPAGNDALPPSGDLPPVADLPPVLGNDEAPKTRAAVGGGGIPKVPAEALQKGGANLNRFYFVRNGDTKASVAEMIYGDSAKAADLGKWNKGEFAPGRLVYYQSPQSPDDKDMKPFYQEKGIAPVDYTVKKGDWLSRIAAKKLGSSASYKEIAVLNGIDRPQAIEVGQKLSLYPLDGNAQAMATDTAPVSSEPLAATDSPKPKKKRKGKKVEEPSNPNFNAEVPPPTSTEAPLINAEATPANAIPTPLPTESVPQPEPFKKKKKSGGFDILRLIEQNLFFLILGLGVVVLVGALVFVNKRRKAKAAEAEFGDDAFASPKARRK